MIFQLSQKAKNKGGDKYICSTNPDFSIYFPQLISRSINPEPIQEINLNIHKENVPDSIVFNLAQTAKSKGGDKYICTTNPDFNIYFPQLISRIDNVPVNELFVEILH